MSAITQYETTTQLGVNVNYEPSDLLSIRECGTHTDPLTPFYFCKIRFHALNGEKRFENRVRQKHLLFVLWRSNSDLNASITENIVYIERSRLAPTNGAVFNVALRYKP